MDPLISDKGKEKAADDGFFMERLEMLYEQSLGDLRAFAEREGRPYDEVKRRMAELHSRSLFAGSSTDTSAEERKVAVQAVLRAISEQLESLERLAGMHSFFLVVSPHDTEDEGFLGGTIRGREFWRGHRGCGVAGAQAFKAQCVRSLPRTSRLAPAGTTASPAHMVPCMTTTAAQSPKKGPAREIKTELYGAMRDALRAVSGVRNAEMKWSNHSKLDVYGVDVCGWPDTVPRQNPSTLSVAQNKLLLDLLREGKMFFKRREGAMVTVPPNECANEDMLPGEEDAIFEDSIDYSWVSTEAEQSICTADHRDNTSLPTLTIDSVAEPMQEGLQYERAHYEWDTDPTTPKKRRIEDS